MSEAASFEIILDPVGEGTSYRVKDYEDQRPNLVDRMSGKSLAIKANLLDVVHGFMSSPNGDPATLVITEFEFSNSLNTRRFQSAEIQMTFAGAESERSNAVGENIGLDPEVVNIHPRYKNTFLPTKTYIELKHSAHLTGQVGAYGANADAGYAWERNETFEKEHEITVNGRIRQIGRDDGRDNTAIWTLMENPKQNEGIPNLLRTAILLKRKNPKDGHSGRFRATVKIEASVDFRSSAENLFDKVRGKIPIDDPVPFDPRQGRQVPEWVTVKANNLEKEELVEVIPTPIITKTLLTNTVQVR